MSPPGDEDRADPGLDEGTVRLPRSAPDDQTALSARRGGSPSPDAEPDLDATVAVDPGAPRPEGLGPRRAGAAGAGDDPHATDPEDGSTMVVRRESRRRAAARAEQATDASPPGASRQTPVPQRGATPAAPPAADPGAAATPAARAARAPEPADAIYRPRPSEPARVERAPRAERVLQEPVDTAGIEASARARRRRRILVAALAGAVVVAGAVVLLAVLALTG